VQLLTEGPTAERGDPEFDFAAVKATILKECDSTPAIRIRILRLEASCASLWFLTVFAVFLATSSGLQKHYACYSHWNSVRMQFRDHTSTSSSIGSVLSALAMRGDWAPASSSPSPPLWGGDTPPISRNSSPVV